MSLDFLSGLALAVVVVLGVGYIVKEWFGVEISALAARRRPEPPAGANAHLIGAVARVVETGENSGEMRVRVGMERWSARLRSPGGAVPPVGTEVEVKAVDGFVLEVAERAPSATEPDRAH
ncbi:MAG TPA: NfeD family protein [Gammaproteobacteria bacterium]